MTQKLKHFLKQFTILVTIKHKVTSLYLYIVAIFNARHIQIIRSLPLYVPSSAGSHKDIAKLTLLSANQVFPFLNGLLEVAGTHRISQIEKVEDLCTDSMSKEVAEKLKLLFNKYGSDKSTHHDYHLLYGYILSDTQRVTAILEIGLGTNNTDVVSNMSALGKPGASLRAFRDALPTAHIFGADVDKRILFTEERIKTFYVDQTDSASLKELSTNLPEKFYLIIDDGLHAPNANIATLSFALKKLKVGGSIVIEDIPPYALPVWYVVASLLPSEYTPRIFSTRNNSHVFLVKKVA